MSTTISSNQPTPSFGTLRVIVIAAVVAFALGGLSAFVHKAVSNGAPSPVAVSGSHNATM